MSPCFLGTWSPHFLRARDPLGLAERAPTSCAPRGQPSPVRAPRETPLQRIPSCARGDPRHAWREPPLPARALWREPSSSCARGSSTPFPGSAGQPYPRHTRRQPPYLPARRSARHRFLGAWREPLPSCAGGAPRDWCPSLHRKGSPVEGRVSSTPKKGVPTRGPCVLNRVRRGPHSPAAGLNWACRGLDPWCARPGKERRVPTRGPGILTGRHRSPHPRAVRPLLRTQCSPLLGCAPSTAH